MPDELIYDDPSYRSERVIRELGIVSPLQFSRHLDDAINHAATPARADAAAQPWVAMGPRNIGGRIGAIAQDPINPSILYAGSGFGGIWKSTDWGDTWTSLDNFTPPAGVRQALPIGAIAVARSNPQILYVGTGEPTMIGTFENDVPGFGLYRSTDGGATFTNIDHVDTGAIAASRFERIVVDPWEAERCWIASLKGLWRREIGGAITQDVIDGGAPAAASQNVSDIVIDFGDVTGPPQATCTVYAAVRGDAIYRATFTRATQSYGPAPRWTKLANGVNETNFQRIKLALCAKSPNVLYAVFGLSDHAASRVYRTTDRGANWERTAKRRGDDGKQAFYDLVLEVHPKRPEVVFTGSVEVFRSMDSGEHWEKVLDWTSYDPGDRAQHADQHALLFDHGRDGTIWIGNDGGIARSRNLGVTWRKKSYGILAPQFYDITVHPTFPWVTGGGLQDNGSWVGFGGPTWFHMSGGDGGALVFEPNNLQRIITSWQGWQGGGIRHQHGVERCDLGNVDETPGLHRETENKTPLPDLLTARPGDAITIKKLRSEQTPLTDGFSGKDTQLFTGVMEHHPSQANHFLVGRVGSIYLTTDGSKFVKQATPAFLGTGGTPEVAALAYSPSSPGTDWWFVTTQAQFFMTQNSGTLWTDVTPPDLAAVLAAGGPPNFILAQAGTDVAIHPTDPRIVVVTVGMMPGGRVYVTGDKGATWREMSGNGVGATAVAVPVADRLNPSAAMCVAFDPSTPAAGAQTVYVGTLAGIYVCRDLTPPVAAAPNPPAPHWRTFNNNLPLTLIYDIVPVTVRDAANNVVRTALRCGTHGRGIYECQLSPAPARPVELYIRQTPISDGRLYVGPANVANDPRLSAATPMRFDRAYDVRVGNPPFAEFESRVDGAEFDEMLFNTVPTAGLKNTVFVQVHTNGHQENPPNVRVDLYFANAPNEPPTVPDLHANFWAAYPGNPPAGDWRRAGTEFVTGLGAGQPVVARFEWVPPLDVGRQVALLALCTRPEAAPGDANADDLKAAAPTTVMAPTNPASLVRTERRAALRVTAMDFSFPSVFVREDINDAGLPGSVAWGGQGADIIVRPGPEADPDHAFADLGDRRSADLMIGNVTNHVYIRVSNRMDLEMSAHVELFRAPSETLDKAGTWVQIGARADVDNIAPKGSKLSVPFQIANPVDPSPAADVEYKVMYLIAIVTPKGAPSPSRASVTDFTTFWKFLTQGIANTDMSATCRGVRWKATA